MAFKLRARRDSRSSGGLYVDGQVGRQGHRRGEEVIRICGSYASSRICAAACRGRGIRDVLNWLLARRSGNAERT